MTNYLLYRAFNYTVEVIAITPTVMNSFTQLNFPWRQNMKWYCVSTPPFSGWSKLTQHYELPVMFPWIANSRNTNYPYYNNLGY